MMTIYHSNGVGIISIIFLCVLFGSILGGLFIFYIQKRYIDNLEKELDCKNKIINDYSL
jgi:uncharacterized protein YneF (UPF0154 family)